MRDCIPPEGQTVKSRGLDRTGTRLSWVSRARGTNPVRTPTPPVIYYIRPDQGHRVHTH